MTERAKDIPDTPLFRWQAELWAARERRRTLRRRALAIGLGIAFLATTIVFPPHPRFVWNASPSAPIGLYWVSAPNRIRAGDMVIAWPPEDARTLGARRHYIPANVPLVKRVAAASGDRVCALGRALFVNGLRIAERLERDGRGRPMPWWRGCVTLQGGALLLLMDSPASFDGRYFGPTEAYDVVGTAHLLWAR